MVAAAPECRLLRRHPVDAHMAFHMVSECGVARHREACRTHPPALGLEPRKRLAGGMIPERLKKEAPDPDDRRIAHTKMLDRAVGDRAHRFLDGAVLDTEATHTSV